MKHIEVIEVIRYTCDECGQSIFPGEQPILWGEWDICYDCWKEAPKSLIHINEIVKKRREQWRVRSK